MPVILYTPRVNNNDDSVRFVHEYVPVGTFVKRGDPVADVETDKATFTVEAEQDGYVLAYNAKKGDTIDVGSVLAYLGSSADEKLPVNGRQPVPEAANTSPSLKAAILLAKHGLKAADVSSSGERLSAADVERHMAAHPKVSAVSVSLEAGKRVALTPPQRGMMKTVLWQKTEAVPAFLELAYNPEPWTKYAADFQQRHRLLMSPLLSLFARRLVELAVERPAINATIAADEKHLYEHVNLGFIVQSSDALYVIVARQAESMDERTFVQELGDLQRAAMRNKLKPENTSGATIGFSSMGRWPVTSHVPVLLPQTAVMIAHTAPVDGAARLGVTYDHRLLSGGDVAQLLLKLSTPPENQS
jgi:pyruvate/2-oxoglutarate dehydrogenase complex dihydrolipoamide acyltransferase (E2) component